ncbi:otoferlin-like [Stegodyphus dumicola]|uniref:otoferlin-like n=1 Tax=Stegodyphus dumicola TaxID=202533 RepID=UPI0015AC48D3|nr:otoferlin-like [Stegodyphus dumicola]
MNIPRKSLPRASIGGGDLKQILELGAESEQNIALQNKEARALNPDGFVVYPCELENVTPFGEFQDWLHSFDLNRVKKSFRTGAIDSQVAVFKGCFRVYKLPLPPVILDPYLPIADSQEGLFGGLPENNPVRVLVRAYIIQAVNLTPTDVTNTCDAYIVIQLGKQKVNDKDHYISKKLNPVFGKCFEFVANFPIDSVLQIQLYDWDLMGSDDLIGETKIDLENRFYSRHRPICGIPRIYEKTGPNSWRDALTPTQILTKLCQGNQLDGPHITEHYIRIGNVIYDFDNKPGDDESTVENMALLLLHKWQDISPGKYSLTPEHVETRTLYHPSKPGEPQGQLLMWLDMFEEDTVPPSIPRDISIRKPESFELRVIIWNTDEVILADDAFFTGEKMSDIYVKGWLTGKEKAQTTDVHYRSLTGEGNFNWRFIFSFDYLEVEGKMLVMKKVSLFSWDETEFKIPPKLEIEVWDADHFSPDDHLGYLTLDLNRIPRGAKNAALCSLDMLKTDGSVPHLSLFKQHRVKGWWPVIAPKSDKMEQTGKVEIELHLLTKEEAEKFPAGTGRKAPDPLQEPKRPETSFLNILHPLKTVRFILWKNYKWTVIKILMIAALALILLLFFYSAPGYTVKKLLKA